MALRFKGFASGASVSLSATMGGVSDSASVASWGEAYAGTVSVEIKKSTLGIAPEGVKFEISGFADFDTPPPTGIYDERLHNFVFLWDFGDAGASFKTPKNLVSAHRDANVGYGFAASHVYQEPGTYTASVLVIELSSGKRAIWTGTIEVKDPNAEFPGPRTVYVAPDGNVTDAPAGALAYSSLDEALAAVQGETVPHRIMLIRGQTSLLSAQFDFNNKQFPNVFITSEPGTGDKHVVRTEIDLGNRGLFYVRRVNPTLGGTGIDFVWQDIRFEGPWDATSETSLDTSTNEAPVCFWFENTGVDYALFSGCEQDGFSLVNRLSPQVPVKIFHEHLTTNWQDYAFFGDCQDVAFLGCQIAQHKDAMSGGPKDGKHNNHGPIRLAAVGLPGQPGTTIMDGCDLFSRNGWFPNVAGYTTIQPCIRWNMESTVGARMNLQRTTMEGGYNLLAISRTRASDRAGVQVNVVVEKSLFVGSHMTSELISVLHSGVTVRNNLMIQPDVPRLSSIFDPDSFVSVGYSADEPGEPVDIDGPIQIVHNTLVNLMTDANANSSAVSNEATFIVPYTSTTVADNLVHQPNLNDPQTSHAPIDVAALFDARETGPRRRREVNTGSLGGDVAPGSSILVPYSQGDATWFSDPASGWHSLGISGVAGADTSSATFVFGPSGVVITNNSGATWPNGASYTVQLERTSINALPIEDWRATPSGTIELYAPSVNPVSPALGNAANDEIERDFLGRERPTHPSIGALEAIS